MSYIADINKYILTYNVDKFLFPALTIFAIHTKNIFYIFRKQYITLFIITYVYIINIKKTL